MTFSPARRIRRFMVVVAVILVPILGLTPHLQAATCTGVVSPVATFAVAAAKRDCSDCGKKIMFGSKCLKCLGRRAKDVAKDVAEKGRKIKDDLKERSGDVRKKVKEVTEKVRESAGRAKEAVGTAVERGKRKWDELRPARRELLENVRGQLGAAYDKGRDMYAQRGVVTEWVQRAKRESIKHYEVIAQEYVPRVFKAIKDPENRRRAAESIGAAVSVLNEVHRLKRQATHDSLQMLARVPIPTAHGFVPFEEVARAKLLERWPGLRGSSIAEDPVAVCTAIVVVDPQYFINDFEILQIEGEHVSITEALHRSSVLDADAALDVLAIYEATEDLGNCDDPMAAMVSVSALVRRLGDR